jgi:hypothetical protein
LVWSLVAKIKVLSTCSIRKIASKSLFFAHAGARQASRAKQSCGYDPAERSGSTSCSVDYERSDTDSFRYEKNIDGNVVQLDLLGDLPRAREGESIIKVHDAKTSLDLCLIDGAEDLDERVERIRINCREGELVETFEIAIPNAAD